MLILIFPRNLFSANKCAIPPKRLKNFLQANVKITNRMKSQSVNENLICNLGPAGPDELVINNNKLSHESQQQSNE